MTTILNYDEHGFIIGSKRLERGINSLSDNTEEIIQILKTQNQAASTRMARLSRNAELINQNTPASRLRNSTSTKRSGQDGTRTSSGNTSNSDSTLRGVTRRAPNHRASPNPTTNTSPNSTRSNAPRERDENGRFIGGSSRSRDESLLNSLRSRAGVHGNMGNAQGVDPLMDSLSEARDLLSPVTRGAGMAGRAVKWSWSKFKSMKRREPLPRDEERHNRENEKYLKKILEKIGRGGASAAGGVLSKLPIGAGALSLAAMLAKGGKKLLGGLSSLKGMKFLGPIAALAGAADLAMNWGEMDHAEKSAGVGGLAGGGAGAIAGAAIGTMIFPGVGTVVGGALGAWLGSEGGEWLGETASPYIQEWTTAIKGYNLPDKMKGIWEDGMKPFFTKLGEIGGQMGSWIEEKLRKAGDYLGITGDDSGKEWTDKNLFKSGSAQQRAIATAGAYNAGGIGNLDDAMTRRLVASTVLTESAGGNHTLVNQGGYLGRYQAGAAWLADAGMLRGGAAAVKSAKASDGYGNRSDWDWAMSGGMTKFLKNNQNWVEGMSREKYLNSPDIQDKAFQKATNESYKRLVSMGVVNDKTPQREVAGLLKAAHLGGVGNAKKVANGGVGAKDANGTTTRKYYNDIATNQDGLDVALKDKPVPIVDDANDAADVVVEKVKEFFKKPVDEAIDEKLKDQGYGGLGVPAVKRPQLMQDVIDSIGGGSDNTVTGGANRFAPAVRHFSAPLPNLPISKLLQFPTMPKVAQRLDSGGQNPIIIQANNDTISQNVSDRGIAHAITGGLGQDRYWG